MTSEPLLTFMDMPDRGELSSDGRCFDSKGETPFTVYTKEVFAATGRVTINTTVWREEGTTVWVGLLPYERTTACHHHRLGSSDLPGSVACCIDDTTVRLFHGGKELWCAPYTDLGGVGLVKVCLQRNGKVSFEVNTCVRKECTVRVSGPLRFAASLKGQGTCVLDHKGLFLERTEVFQLVVGRNGSKRQDENRKVLSLGVLRGNLSVEEALTALWLYDPDTDDDDDEEEGEETTECGRLTRTSLEEQIHQLRSAIRQQVRELRQATDNAVREAQQAEMAQEAERVQQAERRVAAAVQTLKAGRKSLHANQERMAELLSQQAMDGVHRATTTTHDSQRHRQNNL